jgi:hypothetical protein
MAAVFEHPQNFKQALEIRAHRFAGVGIGLERVDSRTDRFDQKLDIRHELDPFYAQSLPLDSSTTSSFGAPPSLQPTEETIDSLEVLESGRDP